MKPVPRSAGTLAAALGKLVKWFSESQQERINVHVAPPLCNIKMSEMRGVLLAELSQEAIALSLCQQVLQGRSLRQERDKHLGCFRGLSSS